MSNVAAFEIVSFALYNILFVLYYYTIQSSIVQYKIQMNNYTMQMSTYKYNTNEHLYNTNEEYYTIQMSNIIQIGNEHL